jgi:anthranilate synthase component 2
VIENDGRGLFEGLPKHFTATRYHSLIVERAGLPAELVVTASCEDTGKASGAAGGQAAGSPDATLIMALRHRDRPIFGLQFHPESILTEHGRAMVKNFLEMKGA